jgi:glutamate dehydrogenase
VVQAFSATLRGSFGVLLLATLVCAQGETLPGLIPASEYEAEHEEARGQERDAREAVAEKARMLGYSEAEIARVLEPTMVRTGTFLVTLEDGTRIRFPWHRTGFAENSVANTDREIARDSEGRPLRSETNKGGVRLHRGVFAEEVYALALKMDAKLAITGDAVAGDAVRGAKGGIGAGVVEKVGTRYAAKVGDVVDPASSALNRAELMRGFGRGYLDSGSRVGLGYDVHAGDVNTKAAEMAELSRVYDPSAPSEGVSGKAVVELADGTLDPRGGIDYRAVSTGEGVWMSARRAVEHEKLLPSKATVASQGWGEVGRAFGLAAVRDGARLVAIQELWNVGGERTAGILLHPKGEAASSAEVKAWVDAVEELRASGADLKTYKGGELFRSFKAGADVSTLKVDVVGYNAMGNALTESTVPALAKAGTTSGKRKVIVEGANLAETAEGARALDALKGKLVAIPGDLANLGGVHVSNLEAVQNRFGEVVTSEEARRSLEKSIGSGWERALALSETHGVSIRKAIELLSADELMKRSLQRNDATKTDIERGLISEEAIQRYQARVSEGVAGVQRVLERLKPFRRVDGTVRWNPALKEGVLREGGGAAHFALALFLKEVAVVAATGDRARIDEFFESLTTTDFYKHYGLFVAGARLGEIGYTRYLQRYVKPRFVSGLLKTNLVLAAGLALPMIVDGHFSGKAFVISLGSLGLSSAAVRSGVAGIKWVVDLRKAKQAGALAKVGVGAGRLARMGGWFYTAAELAVILYVAEEIEGRVNAYLDLANAREALAEAGERFVSALSQPTVGADEASEAAQAYRDAFTDYRNFLYRPLEADESILAGRLEGLARRAKITADERKIAVARLAKHPALAKSVISRFGSLEGYAESLRKAEDLDIAETLEKYTKSFNADRDRHLEDVYTKGKRDGGLFDGVEHLDWLLAGSEAGAAHDPWNSRSDVFARVGRWRSRAKLKDVLEGVSANRLQTYADEVEVLAAVEALLRDRGQGAAADVLAGQRSSAIRLGEFDRKLVGGNGLVSVPGGTGMGEVLEEALRDR